MGYPEPHIEPDLRKYTLIGGIVYLIVFYGLAAYLGFHDASTADYDRPAICAGLTADECVAATQEGR